MDMLRKFLCWIGKHEMVSYTIVKSEYSRLMGYRCKRCLDRRWDYFREDIDSLEEGK